MALSGGADRQCICACFVQCMVQGRSVKRKVRFLFHLFKFKMLALGSKVVPWACAINTQTTGSDRTFAKSRNASAPARYKPNFLVLGIAMYVISVCTCTYSGMW